MHRTSNVVFESLDADARTLEDDLGGAIEDEFCYDLSVVVITRAAVDDVVDRQPFDEPTDEDTKLYVTFLRDEPRDEQVEALLDAQNDAETFEGSGREVHSELRKDELGDGRFTDAGKVLDVSATRRNRDVVTKGRELASS